MRIPENDRDGPAVPVGRYCEEIELSPEEEEALEMAEAQRELRLRAQAGAGGRTPGVLRRLWDVLSGRLPD